MSTPERDGSPFAKRKRHTRKRSSDDFSIEELSSDDMGYDADIETIRPDRYEDAESESEDAPTPILRWHNVDEELAARMGRLGREQSVPGETSHDRGRKRRSTEMCDEDALLRVSLSPDLEIQEVVDDMSLPSPAKRRKKRTGRLPVTPRMLRGHNAMWTDSSGKAEGGVNNLHELSTSTTASEQATPKRDGDDEMMDVT